MAAETATPEGTGSRSAGGEARSRDRPAPRSRAGTRQQVCTLAYSAARRLERESGDLERSMAEIRQPHLVSWGERDGWIAPADLKIMAAAMPDCRLITVPGIWHSMNLESPAHYAGYFGA